MKILAADDHGLIREGLRALLKDLEEDIVFLEAADGAGVEKQLSENPDLDLMLLDVRLPDCDGLALLERLSARYRTLPIVMLSAEFDPDTVNRAIDLGAAGFLPKTSLNRILISALRLVLSGGIYIPPEALRHPAGAAAHRPAIPAAARPGRDSPGAETLALTDRQMAVLARLMEGKSNKQICRELDLAEATVKVHVRAILRALGVNSRAEAIVAASRLNLKFEA